MSLGSDVHDSCPECGRYVKYGGLCDDCAKDERAIQEEIYAEQLGLLERYLSE